MPEAVAVGYAGLEHLAWQPRAAELLDGLGGGEARVDLVDDALDQSAKRRNRSELVTTLTDEKAIAAPATTGLSSPTAARGMAATL